MAAKKDAAKGKDKAARGAPKGDAGPDGRVRLSAHPRARHQIAQAKGWSGIIGFALVFVLSRRGGVPAFDAGLHALVAGIGFSMLGWAAAVAAWRQIAVAEVHAARRRARQVAEAVVAEAAEREAKTKAEPRAV